MITLTARFPVGEDTVHVDGSYTIIANTFGPRPWVGFIAPGGLASVMLISGGSVEIYCSEGSR